MNSREGVRLHEVPGFLLLTVVVVADDDELLLALLRAALTDIDAREASRVVRCGEDTVRRDDLHRVRIEYVAEHDPTRITKRVGVLLLQRLEVFLVEGGAAAAASATHSASAGFSASATITT